MDEAPLGADGHPAQDTGKKRLRAALEAIANGREARHSRLDSLTLARLINKLHGGAVVTAMDVDQLDESWIELFVGVGVDLPNMQRRQKAIQAKFEEFERSHPTYGKRYEN
jgi:hypothetical protein